MGTAGLAQKGQTAVATMKAVRIHSYGGPEVLQYEDAPRPSPAPGEVLVRIHAAGVNPVDWKVREGYARVSHTLPLIPGWDVSGVVEEVGQGVTSLKKGDEVFGRPDLSRDGAYAEYMVARASELARKPASYDHFHAAGLGLAGLTAWQGLFDAAGLRGGQRVLIHAAAGGVGGYAVQLAKWKGAYVIATCSARNRDYVRGLGADEVVDYESTRFEQVARSMDVVFDTMGGETQKRSWQVLKKGGILVSIVSAPSAAEASSYGVRQALFLVMPNGAQLAELAKLADSGKLKIFVEQVLSLSDARRAQEISKAGHVRGKLILRVI